MPDDPWTGPLFETAIDRQIREATERGAFDNLPGAGKPIPDFDGPHDELWWVKQLVRREKVTLVPPSIQLKREVEAIAATVSYERSEISVRRLVADLNARIVANNRIPLEGPVVHLVPLDEEVVAGGWRAGR